MFFRTLLGLTVFTLLMAAVLRMHSRMWRAVSSRYAGASRGPALARKFPEQVLVAGKGVAFRNYVPLTIAMHETGISLKLLFPFSLQCPPLFLPFDDLTCRRTDWFLNGSSFAIRPAGLDVDLIVGDSLWSWIEANSRLRLAGFPDAASAVAADGSARRIP